MIVPHFWSSLHKSATKEISFQSLENSSIRIKKLIQKCLQTLQNVNPAKNNQKFSTQSNSWIREWVSKRVNCSRLRIRRFMTFTSKNALLPLIWLYQSMLYNSKYDIEWCIFKIDYENGLFNVRSRMLLPERWIEVKKKNKKEEHTHKHKNKTKTKALGYQPITRWGLTYGWRCCRRCAANQRERWRLDAQWKLKTPQWNGGNAAVSCFSRLQELTQKASHLIHSVNVQFACLRRRHCIFWTLNFVSCPSCPTRNTSTLVSNCVHSWPLLRKVTIYS